MKRAAANFIFEHAFLPPNLPQFDHAESAAHDILREISQAAHEFSNSFPSQSNEFRVWSQLARSLPKWVDIYQSGIPCSTTITRHLQNMTGDDVLMFYVKPQNAAIVVRNRPTGTIFECFEVLSKTDAVLAAKDALVRHFPARAVFVAEETMQSASFIQELGTAIHKLSVEELRLAMETTTKAKNTVVEVRQSSHPRAVTEWLFGVLSSRGKVTSSPTICKRTHDDVCWTNSSKPPWRRSGVWLCARVALQIALYNSDLAGEERSHYKNFMLFLLSRLATTISGLLTLPDALHILRVKLARRNAKLGPNTLGFVQKSVQKALLCINQSLQRQWKEVTGRDDSVLSQVRTQDVTEALTMKNSRSAVKNIWHRSQQKFQYQQITFVPPVPRRLFTSAPQLPQTGMFKNAGDLVSALVDFEEWVNNHLSNWVQLNNSQSGNCHALLLLMQTYRCSAEARYTGQPERMSVMFLTLFDLWVALDKIATKTCPLLLQYPPELDAAIFAPLLLGKRAELERLHQIECHIKSRSSGCKLGYPSLFMDPSSTCFAIKYYEQSPALQSLRASIEAQAREDRQAKLEEWNTKKENFDRLMESIQSMECDIFVPRGRDWVGRPRHDRYCKKCAKEREAKAIQISKHEWPLPEQEILAKAVVFELAPPEAIVHWRDATWFLVQDIGRHSAKGADMKQILRAYPSLARHVRGPNPRISLGSSVKSMQNAHYFKSGLNMDSVLVKNGLQPRMLDTNTRTTWTAEQQSQPSLSKYCSAHLHESVMRHLGPFVNTTRHTQNQVIAKHCHCPDEMSAHEHLLFGSLRSGERLQWMNVLAMLTSTEVDLNSSSTATLLTHATSQVGTASATEPGYLREFQQELIAGSFCRSLVNAVEASFARIEANWKEATAASVLLAIGLKILSLLPDSTDADRWKDLVRRVRKAGISWIRQLADLHMQQKSEVAHGVNLKDLSRQIVNACLLTRQTFNVDAHLLPSLFDDDVAVADYIEAAIHLHDHRKQGCADDDKKQKSDLLNDDYLARRCEKPLLDQLQIRNPAFSTGIKRFWHSAAFTTRWEMDGGHGTPWVKSRASSKVVHFNVITGSLLVSGRPLSRLPTKYTSDPLYRSVFGELDLDVFISDIDDMEYMSKVLFEGHRIYFGMRGETLLLRASINKQSFEAILRDTFIGDIPDSIVKNHVPWMSLNNGQVFFRPNSRPWLSQKDDWILYPDIMGRSAISMRNSHSFLIDHASALGTAICDIFRPVEHRGHVVISKFDGTTIRIKLPRYHLNFFVTLDGKIQCQELSAVIDISQAIGTLHGLESRLVLRAVTNIPNSIVRSVLIPNGDVVISTAPPHVRVEIRLGDAETLSFSHYRIDDRLGRLVADDLEGHLFKTYLHAITSSPEEDALTGRTGTEESLLSLSDHINRTSVPLSARSQKLLGLIAQLSPSRRYYPPGMRTMHSDTFSKVLPCLSQHDIFFGTVESIVSHNLKASFLFDSQNTQCLSYSGDLPLLDRSYHRSRKLYPCESVSGAPTESEDQHYSSRDRDASQCQRVAASMAGLVAAWPSSFHVRVNVKDIILGWRQITGFGEEYCVSSFSKVLSDDLQYQFARLFNYCKEGQACRERLSFILSLIAFGNPDAAPELRTILAFAVSPLLRELPYPNHNSYDLRPGYKFDRQEILMLLSQCEKDFEPAVSSDDSETDDEAVEAQRQQFEQELLEQRQRVVNAVTAAWPGDSVRLPVRSTLGHYKFAELQTLLDGKFAVWNKNRLFVSQLEAFDQGLKTFQGSWEGPYLDSHVLSTTQTSVKQGSETQFSLLDVMRVNATVDKLLEQCKPSGLDQDLANSICHREGHRHLEANEVRCTWEELEDIVEELTSESSTVVQDYGKSLNESILAWKKKESEEQSRMRLLNPFILGGKVKDVKERIKHILDQSRLLLEPQHESQQALVGAKIWPRVSELALLQLLTAQHRVGVPLGWCKVVILLAREVTALQRVERMQKYMAAKDSFALQREFANPAHAAWETERWPDWLLLEIQNNILIRPVQVRVAHELIKSENGLVQLGMGEGKTSVILPMVVTALATGSHLVRVVVLKPLANEMLRLLSSSLAGLVGRAVYHLPFSRQTSLDSKTPSLLMGLFEECRQSSGVLLTLPEHLNSFRLIGSDKLGTDKDLSTELIRVQKWLDGNARDILDESDELLKPAYELVYTNGEANVLSGAPDRWTIALELLALVQRHATSLHKACPSGIELESRAAATFPHIRVLNEDGARLLTTRLAEEVIAGNLPGLPLGHCNAETTDALYTFIHDLEVDSAKFDLISDHFRDSAQFDLLYVIRGLISQQILTHALRKRWLVNYGLDRSRCLAAVPYRAKSVPSPSAEFAQPETLILLTALSFYYTGIQREDLRRCILILLKSPDPADDYCKWVANSTVPVEYRSANSLNLDDAYCIDELYSHLRYNKALIDFFLRQVVYPKEAKEFRHKLSSSAWDLCATDGGKVTSGFSGTCDSRIPLTCFQKDIEDLRHGTASTLATLLRYDNRQYICAVSPSGARLSTDELLEQIVEYKPQSPSVIIDVGALFLEDNKEIAAKWLRLRPEKMAAIFFNEKDEKMVLNRDGSIELFASSIFKDEIGGCLIYLDEFHTRGTDFQLPDHFKAAVLLGPGLLKDNLVQACMRMRKLAVSQSVTFFAPPEVDNSIRAYLHNKDADIDSSHVIRWCIFQSCRTLRSQQPLWTLKGLSHSRRRLAFSKHVNEDGTIVNPNNYLGMIREREGRPVAEMYRADKQDTKELPFEPSKEEKMDGIISQLLAEWDRTEISDIKDSGISEEQEREILHEVEEEREVQRPDSAEPAWPSVSPTLWGVIHHGGSLPKISVDLRPAFDVLQNTRLASEYSRAEWPMEIIVTEDFMRTIVPVARSPQDDFLRPVQWVLLVSCIRQPVIISPHEAQTLIPEIRKHKRATLILYQARTGRNMMPFDAMNVYQIPESTQRVKVSPAAISLLNLFAGQLYFTTFEDYQRLCTWIGLWDGERPLPALREVANDNFVSPASRAANGWTECKFSRSPVGMLKAFIGMRRLGIEWGHTHMGRILAGRILRREDFEEDQDALAGRLEAMALGENERATGECSSEESSGEESSSGDNQG